MTDRIPLDHLTSDQLDALYERLEAAEADLRAHAETESADAAAGSYALRAETVEAQLASVRETAAWIRRNYPGLTHVNDRLTAALDQPAPAAATQATEPPLLLPHTMATTLHRTLGQLLGDQDAQAIARLRELHREDYGSCAECTHEYGVPYPCPTIRTLDQQEQPRV